MRSEAERHLYVLSGPSGSGKTTICKRLFREIPELNYSVSVTTRAARPDEVEGRDYHFVSAAEFERLLSSHSFAEWAEVHGNRYGTLKSELEMKTTGDRYCLLDVDVQGARSLRAFSPHGRFIFIVPPDVEELRRRLEKRDTETPEVIALRLRNAIKEMESSADFDYIVVNDDLERAFQEVKSIIIREKGATDGTAH